jgi:hypothetical protein
MPARPRWFALVAGFCSAAVIASWTSRWRHRPMSFANAPVVSVATVHGFHPLANLVPYAAGLALAIVVPIALTRVFRPSPASAPVTSPIPSPTAPLAAAACVAFAIFLVTNSTWDPASTLVDLFHEGEVLGFAPAFRSSPRPFEKVFLIHGFDMDVVPALLGHDVAGSRVVRMVEHAGTWIAALWLVREAATSADPRSPGAPALALAIFCLLNTVTYAIAAPRSLVCFAQAAAMVRVLRRPERSRTLAALVGASLAFGFLHNYGEAGASLVTFAAGTAVATARRDAAARTWWRYAVPGVAAGVAAFVATLGPAQVRAIAEQVIYWARYGGWIWFLPLAKTPAVEHRFFWAMLAGHGWTLLHLWGTAREGGLRAVVLRDGDLCVLLALALASLRGSLDRADGAHLALGGIVATVLLLSLSLRALVAAGGWSARARIVAAVVAASLSVHSRRQLDPRRAAAHLVALRGALADDDRVVPEAVRTAVATLRTAVAAQRCFYTLDSNGVWYYLFDRPSCSRFHQIEYARTRDAQRDVIEALRRERPEVIFFRDPAAVAHEDGPANGEHLVYSYVLREYRPAAMVAGRWLWRRAAAPLALRDRKVAGETSVTAEAPPGTVRVSGSAEVPAGASWAYVTIGSEPIEIAPLRAIDGARAGFDVLAPVGFLPAGSRDIGVAVHDPRTDELLRVCSKC